MILEPSRVFLSPFQYGDEGKDVHSWMAAFAAMTSFARGGVALRAVSASLRLAAMTSFARKGLRPLTPYLSLLVTLFIAGCQKQLAPALPDLASEVLHVQSPVAVVPEPAPELPYSAEQTAVLKRFLAGKRLAYAPVSPTADVHVGAAEVAERMMQLFGMVPAPALRADYVVELVPTGEWHFANGGVRTTYAVAFYDTRVVKPLVARRFTFDMNLPVASEAEGAAAHSAARNRAVWSALVYGGLFDGLVEVLNR